MHYWHAELHCPTAQLSAFFHVAAQESGNPSMHLSTQPHRRSGSHGGPFLQLQLFIAQSFAPPQAPEDVCSWSNEDLHWPVLMLARQLVHGSELAWLTIAT